MKKQYITPQASIIVVNGLTHLMTGSYTTILGTNEVSDGTTGFTQYGRRGGFWEDDEEE